MGKVGKSKVQRNSVRGKSTEKCVKCGVCGDVRRHYVSELYCIVG